MKKIRREIVFLCCFILAGMGQLVGQINCLSNETVALTDGSNGPAAAIVFAENLIPNPQVYTDLEVSKDGISYGPSISFDCNDLGAKSFYVKGIKNGEEESCDDQLTVIDVNAPVAIANDAIYLDPGESLTVAQVDGGSYDNCGITDQTLSHTTFPGTGTYDVTYTVSDASGNVNSSFTTVYVNSITLACNAMTLGSLDADGLLEIYPEDILEGGPYNLENMQIGLYDENGTQEDYGDFLTLDCDDIGEVWVEVFDVTTNNSCWGTWTIEDKMKPIPYTIEGLTYSLNGGNSVTVPVSAVDAGSFDNCGIASMTLSQSTFTAVGTYNVTFTVTDYSGNSDFAVFTITIVDGDLSCNDFVNIALDGDGNASVTAESFIEGNGTYDSAEVSLDNINFSNTLEFDCSDIGQTISYYVQVENNGTSYTCDGVTTIEDKLAPVVTVEDITVNLDSSSDSYSLSEADISNGSFDNCSELTFSFSQTELDEDDWGNTQVTLTATDISGNTASANTTVTVLIDGAAAPLQCNSFNFVITPLVLPANIWASDFVTNADDFDQILLSLDEAGPYTESISAPCGINGESTFTVYIEAVVAGEVSNCFAELTTVDELGPTAIAESSITLILENGTASLTPEMVDQGSYDNCTDVTFALSKSVFTTADLGINQEYLYVTDENGNTNSVWFELIVTTGTGCDLTDVNVPADIVLVDEDLVVENLSVENLQAIYGFSFEEVHPYTVATCENLLYTFSDQVFMLSHKILVRRNWVFVNWSTNMVESHEQNIILYADYPVLACNDEMTVVIDTDPVTLLPIDVLEGGPYNYDNLELEIVAENGNIVTDNMITTAYIGQQLTYEVTDAFTGNVCWGNINVEASVEGCILDENDISYPLPTLQIPSTNVDASVLTPEYIATNYDYNTEDVQITWPDDECLVVALAYDDQVFNVDGNLFKILRTFTVLDWVGSGSGNPVTWTYTQVIYVGINPEALICDFLPRTAPVGDCESGHTLDDDVEWPANLEISDYRITPEELVAHSMVDILDAQPSFYNNPDDYSASYLDILIDLNATELVLGRAWAVSHEDYDFTWNYSQTITIDISDFDELVTVNTGSDRAMPGVIINSAITTNMQGVAYVSGSEIESITYEENEYLNGINILDYLLLQRHLQEIEALDQNALLAGDINLDDAVTTADLIAMQERILGLNKDYDWNFYAREVEGIGSIEPKGAFVAIKAGDIDDSVLLMGDDALESTDDFEVSDILLNAGESYEVPIQLNNAYEAYGVEFRIELDEAELTLLDVSTDLDFDYFDYALVDGVLTVMFSNYDEYVTMGGEASLPILTLQIEAKSNNILSNAIDLENILSFIATSNFELIVLGGDLEGLIGTGVNSEELSDLRVFPNPTQNYLNIDISKVDVGGKMEVAVYQLNGQKLFTNYENTKIDVSDLNAGMYYYRVKIGEYAKTGKFVVIR